MRPALRTTPTEELPGARLASIYVASTPEWSGKSTSAPGASLGQLECELRGRIARHCHIGRDPAYLEGSPEV